MKHLLDMRKTIDGLTASLEDHNDGKSRIEKEFVYFIKLEDVSTFMENNKDKAVLQEQYEIKIPKVPESRYTSRIRVRAIDDTKYVLCVKAHAEGKSTIENELDTTLDMFDLFKAITAFGQKKTRYTLPIADTDLAWEVDIFQKTDGSLCEWIKIDLEVPEEFVIQNKLPALTDYFQTTESITNQWGERTEQEEALLKTIYDSFRYEASTSRGDGDHEYR